MLGKKNKKNRKSYSEYPCDVYLHNALRFIKDGKIAIAYEEICWAITKSGGELTEEERNIWNALAAPMANIFRDIVIGAIPADGDDDDNETV